MNLQLTRPLVFFDLETTGTDTATDRIVQMYFIKMTPEGYQRDYSRLVNPGIPIPPEATAVHGITDEDVIGRPTFRDLAEDLYQWLKGSDLAGYNSDNFDIPLLSEEFHRAGITYPEEDTRTTDVYTIEKKVNSHKLGETFKR